MKRVVAEVEDQAGELFPPVGFIVTNLTLISLQQRLINTAGDLDRKRLSISPSPRARISNTRVAARRSFIER